MAKIGPRALHQVETVKRCMKTISKVSRISARNRRIIIEQKMMRRKEEKKSF
jgi:hypothetical protein